MGDVVRGQVRAGEELHDICPVCLVVLNRLTSSGRRRRLREHRPYRLRQIMQIDRDAMRRVETGPSRVDMRTGYFPTVNVPAQLFGVHRV